jgi:hypothetical protein
MTVDKEFIIQKIGNLEKKYYQEITKSIQIVLDLDDNF